MDSRSIDCKRGGTDVGGDRQIASSQNLQIAQNRPPADAKILGQCGHARAILLSKFFRQNQAAFEALQAF